MVFIKQVFRRNINSIGLWYSAMTQRLGLKPEDEYIPMGMAYGDPISTKQEYLQICLI